MFWGSGGCPEKAEQMQEGLCLALLVEDFVLVGLCYCHGNGGRVGIETVNEVLPLARGSRRELARVVGRNVRGGLFGQAIPFPGQLPEPSPSGAGAGWAIGVALP